METIDSDLTEKLIPSPQQQPSSPLNINDDNETDNNENNNNQRQSKKSVRFSPYDIDNNRPSLSTGLEQQQPQSPTSNPPSPYPPTPPSQTIRQRRRFIDHHTLRTKPSIIPFSDVTVHVYEQPHKQLILEERQQQQQQQSPQTNITVKYMTHPPNTTLLLRILYTFITFLMSGFLFIISLNIICRHFLNLVLYSDNDHHDGWLFVGTLLSLPLYVRGLARLMTVAGAFTRDAWDNSHTISRAVMMRHCCGTAGGSNNNNNTIVVVIEWGRFVLMIVIPLLTICVTLLFKVENWWEISGSVWFGCVGVCYVVFAVSVFVAEVEACFRLLWLLRDDEGEEEKGGWWWLLLLKRGLLLHHVHVYSGYKYMTYFVDGPLDEPYDDSRHSSSATRTPIKETIPLYTHITTSHHTKRFFIALSPPLLKTNNHPTTHLPDDRPYMTTQTWSLEKTFFRFRRSNAITVISGPGAIHPHQVQSSVICSIVTLGLALLLVVSVSVWLDYGWVVTIVVLVVVGVVGIVPRVRSSLSIMKVYKDVTKATEQQPNDDNNNSNHNEDIIEDDNKINNDETTTNNPTTSPLLPPTTNNPNTSHVVFKTTDTYQITRPTNTLCWIIFITHVAFLFLWPFITFIVVGDVFVAIFYSVLSLVTAVRQYFNPAMVLEEFGSLDDDVEDMMNDERGDATNDDVDPEEEDDSHPPPAPPTKNPLSSLSWTQKSRISLLSEKISHPRNHHTWELIFFTLILLLLVIFIAAFQTDNTEANQGETYNYTTYLPDFYYERRHDDSGGGGDLEYPTCRMTKTFDRAYFLSLSDYAFLGTLAYYDDDVVSFHLDSWFGSNVAVNRNDIVESFRQTLDGGERPMEYKYITFPNATINNNNSTTLGIIVVRGTTNAWDAITDLQLWSTAFLVQGLRAILPAGAIWTPVLPGLIAVTNAFYGDVSEISFYEETTDFANYLLATNNSSKNDNNNNNNNNNPTLLITGHSLGGGLAIITGAQANIPAVGLSAPNAMLSRRTFDPPLTVHQLDTLTFNIIPARDPIAHIDDRSALFQMIDCKASTTEFFGCHDSVRSLCEIMTKCGSWDVVGVDDEDGNEVSVGRPALCECALLYGYEKPMSKDGNRTFEEACDFDYLMGEVGGKGEGGGGQRRRRRRRWAWWR